MAGPWEAYGAADGPWAAYADTPPAAADPPRGYFGRIADAVGGAISRIGADAKADYQQTGQGDSLGRKMGLIGDVLNVPGAAIHAAVSEPFADVADKIPLQAYAPAQLSLDHGLHIEPSRAMTPQETHEANAAAMDTALSAIPAGAPASAVDAAAIARRLGVAGEAAKPQGALSKVLAPYAAAVSKTAAEREAGRTLASRASDPAAVAQALEQPAEIIPGSQPTTFQQTGDMGLGALERETATKDPAAFQQRAAEQNSARRAALGGVEDGGDPNDVAKALKAQFDDLNATHDAQVEAATTAAQEKAATALGPEETPDAQGSAVRDALTSAETAARASEGGLWQAVDPEGNLTGNTTHTAQTATEIREGIAPTAKPMQGEEAAIFEAAEGLPPLSPVSDLIALRSRVSTEMRAELVTNGRTPVYARLSRLRGAIEDNLAHSISQEVANEARAGTLEPSQSVAARVQSWADEWHASRNPSPASGEGVPQGSAQGSPATAGILRTEGPAPEGQGSPEGAPGVSNAPSFDQAASERLGAATQATKDRAQTFGAQPVSQSLATTGTKDNFRLPDGQVAGKFFHPGMSAFAHMQALLKAAGDAVMPVIERYAATTLRRAALKADGTLDPAKFAQWQKSFGDALRALPAETRAKFASAAKAAETLAQAQAERATALKEAQQGAIGKLMGLSSPEDVVKAVGNVLNGSTPVADMKALAKATSGDPVARQGLRRAITDYIASKFIGNTEAATSGDSLIKADAYQTFIRQNRAALHLVFSPDEVRTMEAVAEDIQRAKRSQNAVRLPGGSNTAQDSQNLVQRVTDAAGKSWLHVLGGALGAHFGPFGAAAGVMTAHLTQALRARGIARVDQLVSEAMLDPKLARELLKNAPRKSANWNAGSAPLTAALWAHQSSKDQTP